MSSVKMFPLFPDTELLSNKVIGKHKPFLSHNFSVLKCFSVRKEVLFLVNSIGGNIR